MLPLGPSYALSRWFDQRRSGLGGNMWTYANPVSVVFGSGVFDRLADLIAGRAYALVTYPEPAFADLAARLQATSGAPVITIQDVAPT